MKQHELFPMHKDLPVLARMLHRNDHCPTLHSTWRVDSTSSVVYKFTQYVPVSHILPIVKLAAAPRVKTQLCNDETQELAPSLVIKDAGSAFSL